MRCAASTRSWRPRAHGRRIAHARGLPALGIGIGVAHGPLVFGIIGVERRLEYTVIGETVNLAAKLEKHNKAEGAAACATGEPDRTGQADRIAALVATGFEIRHARAVAGTTDPLDLAVWRRQLIPVAEKWHERQLNGELFPRSFALQRYQAWTTIRPTWQR